MSTPIPKAVNSIIDVGSVGTVGVSWLGILPTVVSVIASLVAVAWIAQRWYWQAKDRKDRRTKNDHK